MRGEDFQKIGDAAARIEVLGVRYSETVQRMVHLSGEAARELIYAVFCLPGCIPRWSPVERQPFD